ncbi:type III pantothenate kinase [Aquifex aeolicus]|uniref:Type III pantothenate kinase n=1 Tax=Aquifex aeolicus (strain VF5) TaxID=224324 RepID=COAX_AQUAE|nr:type III pantothenate kinase [Aquifex aeolicus]O67753.1 RecName: Full=Type III pantothenate kinase; AltName: Full=PanK-III; AltName: Full=Pantothenic acid kinase [Aquifex aeolicus VF5]AAC07720.1 putative protein [Aquifex aeolicus VF5]
MRFLTVDVGNSSVDIALWEGKKVKDFLKLSHEEFLKEEFPKLKALGISVKQSFSEKVRGKIPKIKFLKKENFPIQVDYKTPETLGTDRVALAYSAKKFYGKNVVVISAGTALVIDLVLEGKFKGGFITLGLGKKLKILSDLAEGIPEFFPEEVEIFLGRSTRECVLGGAYRESTEFIKSTLKLWRKVFKRKFKVVITGGEGKYFSKFGIYDPLLVHRGMRNLLYLYHRI